MTDKTEAQPEALRLAEAQRYSEVVHHANVKASLAYVARKTGLGYQDTERLLELALQRGDLADDDYSGRKMEKIADDRLASLEAQLVAQTNRAAAAEQQVTALTQRLDMANRLNTDAREELARMTEKNAWLEDEMRSQCNIHGMAAEREAKRMTQNQRMHERIAELETQLSARQAAPNPWQQAIDHELVCLHLGVAEDATKESAAKALRELIQCHVEIAINPQTNGGLMLQPHGTPPPPEREPLTDELIARAAVNAGMKPIYDKPKKPMVNALGSSVPFTWLKAFAHGIGATND